MGRSDDVCEDLEGVDMSAVRGVVGGVEWDEFEDSELEEARGERGECGCLEAGS